MPPDTIRWLHLSDFHTGKDDYAQLCMFEEILDNVQANINAGKAPDFVFITGDIANKGKPEDFALFLTGFYNPLVEALPEKAKNNIYLVPGNHDVDRSKAQDTHNDAILKGYRHFFTPTGRGYESRKSILDRFKEFREKTISFGCGDWIGSIDGFFAKPDIPVGNLNVGILCLNTAWLSDNSKQDRHRLTPGMEMVREGLKRINDSDVRIVLGHHPTDWFMDNHVTPMRTLFGRHKVLYLHGHLHFPCALNHEGGGQSFLSIQAGASFVTRPNKDDIPISIILWCELDMENGCVFAEPLNFSFDYQEWRFSECTSGHRPRPLGSASSLGSSKVSLSGATQPT